MNNQYDTLTRNIPVRFYADDPSTGAKPIGGIFYTGRTRVVPCDTFSVIIPTPIKKLYAVVNDEGKEYAPAFLYPETNYTNNLSATNVDGFRIQLTPADTLLYRGSKIQLGIKTLSGKPVSYHWKPDPHLSCTTCPQPMAIVPFSKQFMVTAKNRYGCISTDTILIQTFSEGPVHLPTAFTPNGDGLNDVFYVISSLDVLRITEFNIFNRFGQQVFRKTDALPNNPVNGWNGHLVNGQKAPTGVYIYQLVAHFRDGRSQVFKGSVLVIR
jgi:gliding motility-associated-like protein